MGKRFPIPEFDYERLKDRAWAPPRRLSASEASRLAEQHAGDDGTHWSAQHVELPTGFAERQRLQGEFALAVMCLLPPKPIQVIGRSRAWAIQQALVVDSLDPARSEVLIQWKTPRPINTRLGPDDGATLTGVRTVYVVCGHRYSDYWIVNRTAVEEVALDARTGFSVISASDEEINDFHACNLSFSWS
jgi:hypothetical protein